MRLGRLFFLSLFFISVHSTYSENSRFDDLVEQISLPAAQVVLGATVSVLVTAALTDASVRDDIANKLESISSVLADRVGHRLNISEKIAWGAIGLALLTLIARVSKDSSETVQNFTKYTAVIILVGVPLGFVSWLLQNSY